MNIKSITLALVMALGLTTSASGVAQVQLSDGCDFVNSDIFDAQYGSVGPIMRVFATNERILLSTASPISTGTPTTTSLFINSTEVDTDGFPGTVSYQFLGDGSAQVDWEIDSGNVTWTAECFVDDPPPSSATPIPTLGWQGLALLATLLAGFTYYRRRNFIT